MVYYSYCSDLTLNYCIIFYEKLKDKLPLQYAKCSEMDITIHYPAALAIWDIFSTDYISPFLNTFNSIKFWSLLSNVPSDILRLILKIFSSCAEKNSQKNNLCVIMPSSSHRKITEIQRNQESKHMKCCHIFSSALPQLQGDIRKLKNKISFFLFAKWHCPTA